MNISVAVSGSIRFKESRGPARAKQHFHYRQLHVKWAWMRFFGNRVFCGAVMAWWWGTSFSIDARNGPRRTTTLPMTATAVEFCEAY
jgi:hypothetical protein